MPSHKGSLKNRKVKKPPRLEYDNRWEFPYQQLMKAIGLRRYRHSSRFDYFTDRDGVAFNGPGKWSISLPMLSRIPIDGIGRTKNQEQGIGPSPMAAWLDWWEKNIKSMPEGYCLGIYDTKHSYKPRTTMHTYIPLVWSVERSRWMWGETIIRLETKEE